MICLQQCSQINDSPERLCEEGRGKYPMMVHVNHRLMGLRMCVYNTPLYVFVSVFLKRFNVVVKDSSEMFHYPMG